MMTIELTKGYVALVDDEDYETLSLYKWRVNRVVKKHSTTCYALTYKGPDGVPTSMHRVVMNAPAGLDVDHIDQDGLNNVRANLRLCTEVQNAGNTQTRSGSSSKYKGVSLYKRLGLWQAVIGCTNKGGQMKWLGNFKTEEEAARAYDAAALERYGEFALLNFPPSTSKS